MANVRAPGNPLSPAHRSGSHAARSQASELRVAIDHPDLQCAELLTLELCA